MPKEEHCVRCIRVWHNFSLKSGPCLGILENKLLVESKAHPFLGPQEEPQAVCVPHSSP